MATSKIKLYNNEMVLVKYTGKHNSRIEKKDGTILSVSTNELKELNHKDLEVATQEHLIKDQNLSSIVYCESNDLLQQNNEFIEQREIKDLIKDSNGKLTLLHISKLYLDKNLSYDDFLSKFRELTELEKTKSSIKDLLILHFITKLFGFVTLAMKEFWSLEKIDEHLRPMLWQIIQYIQTGEIKNINDFLEENKKKIIELNQQKVEITPQLKKQHSSRRIHKHLQTITSTVSFDLKFPKGIYPNHTKKNYIK